MDGCQALGLVSERKYERNYSGDGYGYLYADGVSFVKLASLSEFMSDPLKEALQNPISERWGKQICLN